MEKIIKNTIEDFTDDKKLIEIEKLMLDKKYDEAYIRIIDYKRRPSFNFKDEEELVKITNNNHIFAILGIVCLQRISLINAVKTLLYVLVQHPSSLFLHKFILDICNKIKNGKFEERQTKEVNDYLNTEITLEQLEALSEEKRDLILEVLSDYQTPQTPQRQSEIIAEYFFNKFQK